MTPMGEVKLVSKAEHFREKLTHSRKSTSLWHVFIFFILAGLFVLEIPSFADDLENQIKREQQRLEYIQTKITQHKKEAASYGKKEKSLLSELEEINQKEELTRQNIKVLELKEKKLNARIKELTQKIKEEEALLAKAKSALSNRVVSLYKYGSVSQYKLLFSARNVQEAMSISYLLGRVAKADGELIVEVRERKRSLEASKEELQRQKNDLLANKKTLESERKKLLQAQDEQKKLLSEIRRQKSLHEKAAAEFAASQRELQDKIKSLLAEKRRRATASSSQRLVLTAPKGKLLWPVNGTVISDFGTRVHPVFKTKTVHTGIDIDVAHGTPVKAAARGEVLFTGWLKGYGQVVILDHGGDMTTVYAHLSAISVREGQVVNQGSIIGRVGNTGVATGPHLHFEVRINANAVDPLKYLPR